MKDKKQNNSKKKVLTICIIIIIVIAIIVGVILLTNNKHIFRKKGQLLNDVPDGPPIIPTHNEIVEIFFSNKNK